MLRDILVGRKLVLCFAPPGVGGAQRRQMAEAPGEPARTEREESDSDGGPTDAESGGEESDKCRGRAGAAAESEGGSSEGEGSSAEEGERRAGVVSNPFAALDLSDSDDG